MKKLLFLALAAFGLAVAGAAEPKPIKALMITGGGSHDYTAQRKTLEEGLKARLNIDLTILQEGTEREHMHSAYNNPDWAKGYDVIIHNECFGTVKDVPFIEKIAAPHKAGVPAVILHASVHAYRYAETDVWRDILGQKSMRHENRQDMLIKLLDAKSPIMRGFPAEVMDPQDENYMIEKVWPGVTPLAKAIGQTTNNENTVVWTHTEGKVRAFVTTLGHLDATMKQDWYLDMVARGVLWSVGKLKDDGSPMPGYGRALK
jgi:type 1 glutamine amidotransferase